MRFPFYPFYQTQPSQAEISMLVVLLLFLKIIVKNSLAIFESQTREKIFSRQKYSSYSYFLGRHLNVSLELQGNTVCLGWDASILVPVRREREEENT